MNIGGTVSLSSIETVYKRLKEQAYIAESFNDSTSAAAFYWACAEMERVWPILKRL